MSLGIKVSDKKNIFGETVYIRSLSGGEKTTRIIELLHEVGSKPSLMAELGAFVVCACLCDEGGNLLYDDPEKVRDDAAIGFLTEFTEAALDFSGLKDDAETIRKN